jgi:hypothetical protein
MSSARYQPMARQIDCPCGRPSGHLRVRRQEHSSQLFQPARPQQPTQQDGVSFEQLHWLTAYPLDKRIGRRHYRNSHVIVPPTYARAYRDHHHTIAESAFKDRLTNICAGLQNTLKLLAGNRHATRSSNQSRSHPIATRCATYTDIQASSRT